MPVEGDRRERQLELLAHRLRHRAAPAPRERELPFGVAQVAVLEAAARERRRQPCIRCDHLGG